MKQEQIRLQVQSLPWELDNIGKCMCNTHSYISKFFMRQVPEELCKDLEHLIAQVVDPSSLPCLCDAQQTNMVLSVNKDSPQLHVPTTPCDFKPCLYIFYFLQFQHHTATASMTSLKLTIWKFLSITNIKLHVLSRKYDKFIGRNHSY